MGKFNGSSMDREAEIKKIELEQERESVVDELAQLAEENQRKMSELRRELLSGKKSEAAGEKGYEQARDEIGELVNEKHELQEKIRKWQKLYEEERYDEYFQMEKEINEIYEKIDVINKRIRELETFIIGHPVEQARDVEDEAFIRKVEREEKLREKLRRIDEELKGIITNGEVN